MPIIHRTIPGQVRRDISGQDFNSLHVQGPSNKYYSTGTRLWECVCVCGVITFATAAQLKSGGKKSCGCLRHKYSHGLSHTRCSQVHDDMMYRCYNPAAKNWHNYGGRGIQICQRWHDIREFYADMGEPSQGMSIERINNDGNYSCGKCPECLNNNWPMNCRWATKFDQLRNKRTNRRLTAFGQTLVLNDWVKLTGLSAGTIYWRLSRLGWSVEDALTKPTRKGLVPKVIHSNGQD